jgi:ankyrin repeat protein
VVKLLKKKGAELESKSNSGQTLLSYAASRGHRAVVKLPLETKDDNGWMPQSYAAEDGDEG